MATFRIAGKRVALDRRAVERRLRSVLPEPVREHYVVVGGRRFPPKQVVSVLTGIDRADFTTHQARRVLKRLGFVAARKSERHAGAPAEDRTLPHGGRQAAALAPYAGRWVALGEPDEALVAAESAREVVAWLAFHEQRAERGVPRPGERGRGRGARPGEVPLPRAFGRAPPARPPRPPRASVMYEVCVQRTNVYLESRQLDALRLVAQARGRSVAELVRDAVDEWLSARGVAVVSESEWQRRFDALLERRRALAGEQPPKEKDVEHDVLAAVREVRRDRAARRR